RRPLDAIAEVQRFATQGYHWVFEADITACFDEISHSALLTRVRRRVADKRVLALVKAFLKAGIMSVDGAVRDSDSGTPQGGLCAAAHNPPYEQRWIMRSAGLLPLVRAVVVTGRCA
ncbi:MAG: hypothetical protein ACRDT6_26850, partial [Micromonosporaceae bacterium]